MARQPTARDRKRHPHADPADSGAFAAVHAVVRRIPAGRIMTYGQIAQLIGQRMSPVGVGWAMRASPPDVPWQRVVNAQGGCSTDRSGELPPGLQRSLLEAEGVEFSADGTLQVERYRWQPGGQSR